MPGGRVTAGASGYGAFESQIKAGKLRALPVSSGHVAPAIVRRDGCTAGQTAASLRMMFSFSPYRTTQNLQRYSVE